VMQIFGFSLNNLSLFGLVLAIGIVVDDAIVVVENVERQIENGLNPQEAAYTSMDEVSGALIATSLVLLAVFIPTAFVAGITGAFYQQFAVTIATATVVSTIVSLTLSPALCRVLLKPTSATDRVPFWKKPTQAVFGIFNKGFDRLTLLYGRLVTRLVRAVGLVMLIFVGLLFLTGYQFTRVPSGFIPAQDQGYLISAVSLPQGAALDRTDEIIRQMGDIARADPDVAHVAQFAGFNGANFTSASNAGGMFIILEDFAKRDNYKVVQKRLNAEMAKNIDAGRVLVIIPPPVRGVGNGSGFKMMVQDRAGLGLPALQKAARDLMIAANQDPMLENTFTLFEVDTPQIYLDIDRQKAELMGVPVSNIFDALEIYLGSAFINDFNYLGRTFQVTAQADAQFRDDLEDLALYNTRNQLGQMVPLGTLAEVQNITGSSRVQRYNLFPAAAVQGQPADGISTGEALTRMEELAAEVLPQGMDFEWTELAYQQRQTGNTAGLIFVLSVVFVFLVLAAQYESLTLPLSVILIVPMTILFGITGTAIAGLSNNILTQIGFIVLIALAAKNAILIVEFARQIEDTGKTRFQAAVEAASLRLRPILMTSLAFILGVVPLVLAKGAGAEMRVSLGVVVFSGMIGVTLFGLLLTPVFYVLARWPHRKTELEKEVAAKEKSGKPKRPTAPEGARS
ncbi:efflux RND transporter permease subunit, partial [Hellea sp.]|nr:efflux RND transporter permease subunit [Hellea sp.]